MRNVFLRKVDTIIFVEREIRSVQFLLDEYVHTAHEFGFLVGNVKSSYIKELLIQEYGEAIGFKSRSEKNRSDFVYDTRGGGDYIETTIFFRDHG